MPSPAEWDQLAVCLCQACRTHGPDGLRARGTHGFANRATHNLWTLLEEGRWIEQRLAAGTYAADYRDHLDNTIYRPLIDDIVARLTTTPTDPT